MRTVARGVATAMLLTLLALLARLHAHKVEAANLYSGDLCLMQGGRAGLCRRADLCPEAAQMVREGVPPVVCSYNASTPIVCCPSARKANRMCSLYSGAVFRYEKDPRNPARVRKCDQCVMKKVPFIIGGSNASVHEFPHMALLGYGTDLSARRWSCGGSLISDQYVLTAAHCLITSGGQPKWVRLGELDLTTPKESQHEDFNVAEFIPHPDFIDGIRYNDIGLIRLDRKVVFTAAIRPACIHTLPEIADPLGIASGWGLIHWADPDNSDFLMKLNLHLYKTDICSFAYRTDATTFRLKNGIVEESMVCAGSPEGGKDTCRGDSGGPLQVKLSNPYCMYSVIGVTSFGKGACGTTLSPSVYTRVSYFVSWLEDIVWPDDVIPESRRQLVY